MVEKIKINLENYSSLSKAEIEIDKIAIIKGQENDDLFKLLFSYLITLSPEGLFAANLGFRSQLSIALDKTSSQLSNKFINEFKKFDDVKNWDEYNISPEYFNKKFSQYKKLLRKHRIKIDSSRIEEYMSFFNENNTYRIAVLQHMVEVEFKYNNLNFRNKSKFNLFID